MPWYQILGIVLGSITGYMLGLVVCYRITYMLWGESKPDEVHHEVTSVFWPITLWVCIALVLARLIIKERPDRLPKARIYK